MSKKRIYSLDSKTWVERQQVAETVGDEGRGLKVPLKIPVVFCIDTGSQMYRIQSDGMTKMEKLMSSIENITRSISSYHFRDKVDLSVTTFSDDVNCARFFGSLFLHPYHHDFTENAFSSIGRGVNLTIELIRERLAEYSQNGIKHTAPYLFIFYGSAAGENDPDIEVAEEELKELVSDEDLRVFPIGIGDDVDFKTLSRFSSEETFERYGDVDFENFLSVLSQDINLEEDESGCDYEHQADTAQEEIEEGFPQYPYAGMKPQNAKEF